MPAQNTVNRAINNRNNTDSACLRVKTSFSVDGCHTSESCSLLIYRPSATKAIRADDIRKESKFLGPSHNTSISINTGSTASSGRPSEAITKPPSSTDFTPAMPTDHSAAVQDKAQIQAMSAALKAWWYRLAMKIASTAKNIASPAL